MGCQCIWRPSFHAEAALGRLIGPPPRATRGTDQKEVAVPNHSGLIIPLPADGRNRTGCENRRPIAEPSRARGSSGRISASRGLPAPPAALQLLEALAQVGRIE